MAATTQNFIWQQGADLTIELKYKEGATTETAVTIDLSQETNPGTPDYEVRMDVVASDDLARLYTFNSAELADVDPSENVEPDTTVESVLTDGAGDTPNIHVVVPRSLTLPDGSIYARMTGASPITSFFYDLFLRNNLTNKQVKILTGTITVEKSYTLWP